MIRHHTLSPHRSRFGALSGWIGSRGQRRGGRNDKRTRSLNLEGLEARQLLASDLVISEFMASNDTGIEDEDHNRPDWIEVLNNSDEVADLGGWFLTDDMDDLDKWEFPAVSLNPNERIVVFASTKNRREAGSELHTNFRLSSTGEYLGLVEPDGLTVAHDFGTEYPNQQVDVSYGFPQAVGEDTPIVSGTSAQLFVPTADNGGDALGTTWTAADFDDSTWSTAANGIGYERSGSGDYDEFFLTDIEESIYDVSSSVYLRMPFNVTDGGLVTGLTLRMQYDDGYVVYINGQEVASRNAPDLINWESQATSAHRDRNAKVPEDAFVDILQYPGLIQSGRNVLAIHALNDKVDSSDFLMIPEMTVHSIDDLRIDDHHYLSVPSPGFPNDVGSTSTLR